MNPRALWFVGLCVIVFLSYFSIDQARKKVQSQTEEETVQRIKDWDKWRAEAQAQADGKGPVKRRPVKSAVPPDMTLLDKHFTMIVVVTSVFCGLLYTVMTFLIRGAIKQKDVEPLDFQTNNTE
tara:strand:+ start:1174 stop:1545 length:372 start_codon:yes stop_codon:yes gene_type:complete